MENERVIMKVFFLILFLPLMATACPENYVGRYLGLNDDQFISRYNSVEIQYENSILTLNYNYEGNDRFSETYKMDGDDHEGDGVRTGQKYAVYCEAGNLVIRREFNEVMQALLYDFHFESNELRLIESFEGTDYKRLAARFKKID